MQRQNIILDLDETLIHTWDKCDDIRKLNTNKYLPIRHRMFKIDSMDYIGSFREHAEKFLDYCFKRFNYVIIWTAGTEDYAAEINNVLFKFLNNTPDLTLDKNHIKMYNDNSYSKPITKIAKKFPELKNGLFLENTFIVDNMIQNFKENPHNGIQIPPYEVKNLDDILYLEDNALKTLMKWFELEKTKRSLDIRKLDKSKIFD